MLGLIDRALQPRALRALVQDKHPLARRKRRRLAKTAAAAAVGAAISWLLFTMIDSGLSRH